MALFAKRMGKKAAPFRDSEQCEDGRGYTWWTTFVKATVMRLIIFLVLLCSGVAVHAHQDETLAPVEGIDCEHPPKEAVMALPGVLGEAGRVICLPDGHRIVSSKAWIWRYTGSFFSMPSVPALAHADTQGMKPPFYFRKVSTEELSADDTRTRSDQLAQQLVTYNPETTPASMSIVKAENNYGHVTEIFIPMRNEHSGWAIVCTPECQPDYVILINKRQSN